MNHSRWIYIVVAHFLQHDRAVVIYYSTTFPRYLNRSCNVLASRGSNVIMKEIMTTKWRTWFHRDSIRTRAPSAALRAVAHVHFVLYLHVFSDCKVVPGSLYHCVQIARGDTLFFNSLRLMLLVNAYIRNAIVATHVERTFYLSLLHIRRWLLQLKPYMVRYNYLYMNHKMGG